MYTPILSFASLAILASNVALSSAAAFTYNSCQPLSTITASGFVSGGTSMFQSTGQCASQCSGSAFIALHDQQCYCGATFTPSSPVASASDCSTPCPGFPTDTCGGPNDYYSVYSTSNAEVASNSSSTATTAMSATPIATGTSVSTATGVVGNVSTSATISSAPSSTPSQVQVNGASVVGGDACGLLMVVVGVLALL